MNKKSQIFIILGMHKSGTTLISDMLHQSGINMVENSQDDISYDTGTKAERFLTKKLNNKILKSDNLYSLQIKNNKIFDREIYVEMQDFVINTNQSYEKWGFKDPRTCFTYQNWISVIPNHKIIVVFRNPNEVWSHYWRNSNWKKKKLIFLNFFNSWCQHNQQILKYLSKTKNSFIVLEYSKFMTDNESFEKLEKFVNHPITDNRKKSLYRNTTNKFSATYILSKLIYKIRNNINPDDIYMSLRSYL